MNDLTTPAGIEDALRQLVSDLARAQRDLAEARDNEVRAKHAFKAAKRKTLLREDRPKVARGGTTTAERDAWVDEQVAREEWAYDLATTRREAAQDHMRTLRDQAELVRSLGAAVRVAYDVAGRTA